MSQFSKIAAVVLAAGKGKRMESRQQKVLSDLGGKPIVFYILDLLKTLSLGQIIVVVGHRAEDVRKRLGFDFECILQHKRLGTGHAVKTAIKFLKNYIISVLVFYGDDSAFHTKETILKLIKMHITQKATLSFITVIKSNPQGLGRIIRDKKGNLLGIYEEKDASLKERLIREINDGCYIFNLKWLQKNINRIQKSSSGEYYLTDLCGMAIGEGAKVLTLRVDEKEWKGINTDQELREAVELKKSKRNSKVEILSQL